ncbi:hypothetical protein [Halomonas sp. NCCP-2165]|nr:hypothetical protein [Halomonas sp. NCCP-2165]GKW48608.1 hypothetical protein NCCP2165_08230 [Halomonas sp. NCCP-2165]
MSSRMSFEICRALTQLTRQLLGAGEREAQTHVLAKGLVYRVVVSLEPVPTEELQDVINRYL